MKDPFTTDAYPVAEWKQRQKAVVESIPASVEAALVYIKYPLIHFYKTKYVNDLFKSWKIEESKLMDTPCEVNVKLSRYDDSKAMDVLL